MAKVSKSHMRVRGFHKLSDFFYILRVRICVWVYFCVYATHVPLSWCITSFIGPANSSSYLNISFCYSPGILAAQKKNCTPCHEQQI